MDILGRCCIRKRYTCHFNYCIPSFHDMDVGAGYYSEMGRFCYPTVDYRFNGLLFGAGSSYITITNSTVNLKSKIEFE